MRLILGVGLLIGGYLGWALTWLWLTRDRPTEGAPLEEPLYVPDDWDPPLLAWLFDQEASHDR